MSVCSKFNVLETYCKILVQMFVQYFIINLLCRQVIAWHKGFYFKFAFVDGHQMFQGFLFYFKWLVIPCCSHFAQHFLEEAVKLIRHTCIAANKLVWETYLTMMIMMMVNYLEVPSFIDTIMSVLFTARFIPGSSIYYLTLHEQDLVFIHTWNNTSLSCHEQV